MNKTRHSDEAMNGSLSPTMDNPRICVIGAGPSGLTTLKNLLALGLTNAACFDEADAIGGNWVFREGQPSVEFSFEEHDEMDPAQGRGWAVLDGDEIDGMIFFHQGDESRFKARRAKRK